MTPEDVDTHIGLGRDMPKSLEELEAFAQRSRELISGVETLTPMQRIDRLAAIVRQQVVYPHTFQSGRRNSFRRFYGETPLRVVESVAGEWYAVSMLLESIKDSESSRVHLSISAEWRNISNSTYFDTSHKEGVDNSWALCDPGYVQGLRSLADLEWTLSAYLTGSSLEDM